MSLFDRQGIPESLLHDQYWQDANAEANCENDISTLISYSLVAMSAGGSEFEMHRLVQYSTKKWLELCDELEAWKERFAVVMDGSYPVPRHKNWKVCEALFPHAQAAVECRPRKPKALEAWASLLFKAGWYASEMGRYEAANDMDAVALGVRDALLGKEHPSTLTSVSNLAAVLQNQGKYEAAEAMNRRALEGREKVLGKEHPSTLTSVSNLAAVLQNQGKYEAAEGRERELLEVADLKLQLRMETN